MVIQTDTSEYGLGAAFIQGGPPIAFASKFLTDIKTRYANIEGECLSVCYGLEKFHTYIYIWETCCCREQSQTTGNNPV